MRALLEKYAVKLVKAGLAEPGAALFGGVDDRYEWNREDPLRGDMERIFGGLAVNSLLLCRPAEPYWSMISLLASGSGGTIRPSDCETRTFLHDIPVAGAYDPDEIAGILRRRKCAVVPGLGVISWGAVSPEQAFIFFSSVCFSCFVKFFADYLSLARSGSPPALWREVFESARAIVGRDAEPPPELMRGPFRTAREIRAAIAEVGRATVGAGLVDSFFGNVSWLMDGVLHISQTTSSLDELEGAIDACPLDGSACTGITASSEYTAHVKALERTGADGILHGHPRFAVIMSMACGERECETRGSCHVRCPRERFAAGVPIVPGEVGTGSSGLCNTLPGALAGQRGVIVHGHGLFMQAKTDFRAAFRAMLDIERMCRDEYFALVDRTPAG